MTNVQRLSVISIIWLHLITISNGQNQMVTYIKNEPHFFILLTFFLLLGLNETAKLFYCLGYLKSKECRWTSLFFVEFLFLIWYWTLDIKWPNRAFLFALFLHPSPYFLTVYSVNPKSGKNNFIQRATTQKKEKTRNAVKY